MSVSQALSETHLHSWNLLFRGKLYVSFYFLECDLGAGFEILCSQYHQDLAGYAKHRVERAATGGCVGGRRVGGTGVNRWGRWDQELGRKNEAWAEYGRVKGVTGRGFLEWGAAQKQGPHASPVQQLGSQLKSSRVSILFHMEKANIHVLPDLE